MTEGRETHETRAKARIGQVLRGKWRLDQLLGVGGMAAVYAATHRNQKRGAVKILHPEVAAQPDAQERFVREGYVANSVDHHGVVSVLDDDLSDDGCAFLVMELLKGESLSSAAERWPGHKMPVVDVLQMADELLDILASAHAKGIVHRDLKPDNLFVTQDRKLKVLDFGIAKLQELSYGGSKTATGTLMGTPYFMPPEQALGEWSRVDARSDIWAVGATMFNVLTGRTVHDADTMQKLLLAAMTRPAPPLASVEPTIPAEVGAIVDRALAFQQETRFPDARSMQAAVRTVRERLIQTAQPSTHMVPSAAGQSVMGQSAAVPSAAVPSAVQARSVAALTAHLSAAPSQALPFTQMSGPHPAPSSAAGPTLASGAGWQPGTLSPTTPTGHHTTSGGNRSTGIAIAIAAFVGIGGAIGLYMWTRTPTSPAATSAGVDAASTSTAEAPTSAATEPSVAAAAAAASSPGAGNQPEPSATASASASGSTASSAPAAGAGKTPAAGSTGRTPAGTGTGKRPQGTDDKYGL